MTSSSAIETGTFGVDKLQFFMLAEEIEFSPSFDCEVQPARFNPATGETRREGELWQSTSGHVVRGVRGMVNTEDYNLTIKPDPDTGKALALLHFSAGAFRDSNLHPLNQEQTRDVVAAVEADLKMRGAVVDLNDASITRIDLARNVALNEPIASYTPVFNGAGARKRVNKKDFGGTGFTIGNTQWELCLYDKGEQMRELGYPVQLRPVNTLRPELRLLKGGVIRDRLGLAESNLPTLLSNWDTLRPAHQASLRKDLLHWREEVDRPAPSDLDASAEYAQDARFAFETFLKDVGLCAMVQQLGAPAAAQFVFDKFPGREHQRRKQLKLIAGAAFRLEMEGKSASGRSLKTLYKELEYKLLD